MRKGEVQGVDYDFVSVDEFQKMIKDDEFLEYFQYGETWKGTRKSALERVLVEKTVWRIDSETTANLKTKIFPRKNLEALIPITKTIYLGVENVAELFRRQVSRDVNTPKINIFKRMKIDWEVWNNNKNNYDLMVINRDGKLDQTVEKILNFCDC
jgi:guanylate kinase